MDVDRLPSDDDSDPMREEFLAFLERDIARRPETLRPLGRELLDRVKTLVEGMTVDLNDPITDG